MKFKEAIEIRLILLSNALTKLSYNETMALSLKVNVSYPTLIKIKHFEHFKESCTLMTLFKIADGLGL